MSFVVLNIYSVNKDYTTDLTNSKQRKKKSSWVIIKISVPVFDLESSDLSALICIREIYTFSLNVLLEILTVPTAGFVETAIPRIHVL